MTVIYEILSNDVNMMAASWLEVDKQLDGISDRVVSAGLQRRTGSYNAAFAGQPLLYHVAIVTVRHPCLTIGGVFKKFCRERIESAHFASDRANHSLIILWYVFCPYTQKQLRQGNRSAHIMPTAEETEHTLRLRPQCFSLSTARAEVLMHLVYPKEYMAPKVKDRLWKFTGTKMVNAVIKYGITAVVRPYRRAPFADAVLHLCKCLPVLANALDYHWITRSRYPPVSTVFSSNLRNLMFRALLFRESISQSTSKDFLHDREAAISVF
jgi:hypothetical protein